MAIDQYLHVEDMEACQVLDNLDDQVDGLQGIANFIALLSGLIQVLENKDEGLHLLAVALHDKIRSELN